MRPKKSRAQAWRGAGARLTLLFALQALGGTAFPQAPAQPGISGEIARQEKIFGSRGADVPSGYITTRSLASYADLLPAGFNDALRKLGTADRWLDIGAGGGQAALDYYAPESTPAQGDAGARTGGKARVVALSIEDRRTDQWQQRTATIDRDRIRYLYGKRLREYSQEELGKFQIITDVYGGFSYTDDLSLFLEKVLGLLEIDGAFYTLLQSVRLEDGKDRRTTWYLTELVDPANRDVKICSWLKSISCVKVVCESKSTWDAPTELILVRKTCNDVSVPALKPLSYEAGSPPGRRFLLQRQAGR